MRQVILAAMVSSTCLVSVPARSEDAVPAKAASSAVSPYKKDLERGYRLKQQNRAAEAIAAFSSVVAKDPSNHAAVTELGYLHAGLKHYASAVKYLSAASAQDPENMRLRMDLAYAQQGAKHQDAAIEQFTVVAARAGEFQAQAQAALDAAKSSDPAAKQAAAKQVRLREQGYAALKRGDKAAAAKAFGAAVSSDPKDEASLKQLGYINLEAGDLAGAAANFEAARALTPNDYVVDLQLGYTYERLQKKEQAREAFGAALASTDEKVHGAAQAALQSAGGPGAPVPAASTSL